ncbi:MAG: TetR/AcrR family transcriptional regulator, partial [Bryobacteraceae bacterium]
MKKRELRLAGIYQSAAEMICRNGYDAATLGEIARAAGLAKAGLYHYFPSKEELLFGIVSHAMDRIEAEVVDEVREIADPKERLRALTANYVRLIVNGPHVEHWMNGV